MVAFELEIFGPNNKFVKKAKILKKSQSLYHKHVPMTQSAWYIITWNQDFVSKYVSKAAILRFGFHLFSLWPV